MPEKEEKEERRPIGRLISEVIFLFNNILDFKLFMIAISRTHISDDHDKIIVAIRDRLRVFPTAENEAQKAIDSLLKQKNIAEARAKDLTALTKEHQIEALVVLVKEIASVGSFFEEDERKTIFTKADSIKDAKDDTTFQVAIADLNFYN